MNFQPIQFNHKDLYEKYFKTVPHIGSEQTFTTPYTWAKSYNISLCEVDNLLCLRGQFKEELPYYWMPVGAGDKLSCMQTLYALSKAENRPFVMIGVYEEDIQVVKAALPAVSLSARASRSIAEYIYDANSLLTLSGKKLHTKRNHVNTFKNTYNYRTEKIDSHNLAEAADFVYAHCNSDEESVAMHRFFDAYLSLNVVGMLLYIDNQLVAVTAGEFINDETALIHLEKADTDFSGAYAAVNQLFIENYFAAATYVNREEDMGIEGLRRAKMSYRPSFLLEKYQITEV